MIVDTSVIIAILKDEQAAAAIGAILSRSRDCRMSAVSYVEAGVVVDGNQNPVLSRRLDDLLREVEISIEPVTMNQARIAREAYRDFGKGRHRAGLNFGDCFAYALAKEKGEALLFKGDDFRHTDIEVGDGLDG
jgi:ribonuclease VapC